MTASSKMLSYLGFARKSGNLMRGYNTCLSLVESGKVRLLIVAEDGAEGTKKRFRQKCAVSGTAFRIYGNSDELSRMTGGGGTVYAVTDENFANVIIREIDLTGSEGEMCNDEKGI